jgi:hypothetical protein
VHIHHFPFFFWTITTFVSHCVKQSLDFSLHDFYLLFRHFTKLLLSGLHTRLHLQFVLDDVPAYSNKVRGRPCKKSFFLLRKANNSTYSSGLVSVPRKIALSGTLGSNVTFLKSPSSLITFLNSVGASALMEHAGCCYCSDSSLRK